MTVSKGGVPRAAILTSSIVGFLCVIAAAVSPDTVFLFLLNSSGAVILFVYLLIAISQVILRRRTTPDKLVVKMWLFPALSIIVIVGDRRGPGSDGLQRGHPDPADAEPAGLGRVAGDLLRHQADPGQGAVGRPPPPPRPATPNGCWCWPTRRSRATS